MSENVDLVRSIYAGRERGDWSREIDWLHPDIEVVSVGGPDPREYSGLTTLAGAWSEFLSAWEDFRVELQEVRVLDEGRVLALFRRSGRGKASGMEIKDLAGSEGADVLYIRDGRIIRLLSYWDRERALADLGLDEE